MSSQHGERMRTKMAGATATRHAPDCVLTHRLAVASTFLRSSYRSLPCLPLRTLLNAAAIQVKTEN